MFVLIAAIAERGVTPQEFGELVAELTDTQKIKVLRLLTIAVSRPEARSLINECKKRGLGIDATIEELSRRLWTN